MDAGDDARDEKRDDVGDEPGEKWGGGLGARALVGRVGRRRRRAHAAVVGQVRERGRRLRRELAPLRLADPLVDLRLGLLQPQPVLEELLVAGARRRARRRTAVRRRRRGRGRHRQGGGAVQLATLERRARSSIALARAAAVPEFESKCQKRVLCR